MISEDTAMWKAIGVALYLITLLVIGIVASRRMSGLRDYYAGDKQFSFWAGAFSARATGESAWLLLGLTGMGATIGLKAFWVVLGEVLGVGIAWLLMCRRFKRLTDTYDSITIPDYLESRFRDDSHKIRVVAAGAMVIFVTIYVLQKVSVLWSFDDHRGNFLSSFATEIVSRNELRRAFLLSELLLPSPLKFSCCTLDFRFSHLHYSPF